MWWEHFKSMKPAGHEITRAEFKKAFKDHNIPKGLMVRKMEEFQDHVWFEDWWMVASWCHECNNVV
jgi:hypothetical protein